MTHRFLITGVAGFIGRALCERLLQDPNNIIFGLDNLNDYYDVNLKLARLNTLESFAQFTFRKIDLCDLPALTHYFNQIRTQYSSVTVIHLAAQAGVQYSLENPSAYIQTNLVGFGHLIELSKQFKIKQFIYASSSSVYGGNTEMPFAVTDRVDQPLSLYAATKRANELMAHSYSHLFQLPTIGLRFFTVYGPWGRPDMALFKFTQHILNQTPIAIYNYGEHERDFTYIDDITMGISQLLAKNIYLKSNFQIYNLGNHRPVTLNHFIDTLEHTLGQKAIRTLYPLQPGDVPKTYAEITESQIQFDYQPNTSLNTGIQNFVTWYLAYYQKTCAA